MYKLSRRLSALPYPYLPWLFSLAFHETFILLVMKVVEDNLFANIAMLCALVALSALIVAQTIIVA